MTLGHASALEEIQGVLALRQEESVRRTRDGDPEEVVEAPEVNHSELGV